MKAAHVRVLGKTNDRCATCKSYSQYYVRIYTREGTRLPVQRHCLMCLLPNVHPGDPEKVSL